MQKLFTLAIALSLFAPIAEAKIKTADQVLGHHIDALKKADLDQLMADYANDAIVITPPSAMGDPKATEDLPGVYVGIENVRKLFTYFTQQKNRDANRSIEVTLEPVSPDVVIMRWVILRGTPQEFSGIDVFTIRKGKIRYQALQQPYGIKK